MIRELQNLDTKNSLRQPLLEAEEVLETVAEEKEIKRESHYLKQFLAGTIAWGCEAGNIPNTYFNFWLITQTLMDILIDINQEDSLSDEAKLACFLFAGHFALHTFLYDMLLIIPPEIYQTIFEKLNLTTTQTQKQAWRLRLKKFFRQIFIMIIYFSLSILSAGGAIGAVEMFILPALKQTLGIITAVIGTFLGINYAHFYYTDSILDAIEFFGSCINHPVQTAQSIYRNPGASLQIVKSFTIVSVYYSTMGVFLLTRFSETFCALYEFPVEKNTLTRTMKATAVFMGITQFFIRFLPIKKIYLPNTVREVKNIDNNSIDSGIPWGYIFDIFLESVVAGTIVVFSENYLNNIYVGILWGGASLIIRLTVEEPAKQQQKLVFPISSSWISFNARLQKSAILLMTAISHLQDMFRDYADIDFNLNAYDIACLTIIIGAPIAKNRFTVDNDKVDKHRAYISKKNEFNRFGTLTNLFKPAAAFPLKEREQLLQIIKR